MPCQFCENCFACSALSQPSWVSCTAVVSPDGRYDPVYLRNYALLNVRNELARLPGAGQVVVFGAGDYAMRVWLDPNKVASRNLSATDVVQAIREQNLQVAAGVVGAPPMPNPQAYQLTVRARGRPRSAQQQVGGGRRRLPGARLQCARALQLRPREDGRAQDALPARRRLVRGL